MSTTVDPQLEEVNIVVIRKASTTVLDNKLYEWNLLIPMEGARMSRFNVNLN